MDLSIFGVQVTDIFNFVAAVVTIASFITMLTPTRSDDAVVDKLKVFLNFLALNILKNKNADDIKK